MEDHDWPPTDLKAHINGLRILIGEDRRLHEVLTKELAIWHPRLAGPVSAMLKARSRYYRGEMVRAKHDIQRYVMGEETAPGNTRWAEMQCDWVTTYLDDLPLDGYTDDTMEKFQAAQMEKQTDTLTKLTYGG